MPNNEISYTKMHSIGNCEYSYFLRYIANTPIKESSASVYGTAIHRAIKAGYDNKLPRDDWAKVFKQEWTALASKDDIVFYSENEYMKKYKDGQEMMNNYYDTFVKGAKDPLAIELFFGREPKVELGGVTLVGVFDQISADGRIVDYKSGVKPTQAELDLDLQFTFYSYAYRQLYGKIEKNLVLRHLPTMKDLETSRTEKDFAVLEEEVAKVVKRTKGNLYLRNLGRSCNSCYFLGACLGKERQTFARKY
jgi:RecB family exonuclease